MMYHHVLSIILWPYAFYVDRAVVAVAYFMITESTNLLLNFRWFLAEHEAGGHGILIVNVLTMISYTVVRILPIPWFVWMMFSMDWSQLTAVQKTLSVSLLVPLALNLFWYKLLLGKALSMLRKGSAKA
uniref:TLC domain-containing protein n=1 Tax=Eutreptiella gymnastica TaxID=73025 RepID=A0A7S1JAJ2_9EUGL|mmetsp:Transcript_80145/g.141411  ORF Transcript_80145/g.141411 Transcript_80145/m.141411 type:complete len:129 (+) Transcript_80145:3-389(+)